MAYSDTYACTVGAWATPATRFEGSYATHLISLEHVGSEQLLAVLALAIIVGPLLASRFRMPSMLGLVIAGTIIGPYVLGWIEPGAVDGLGNIGLLYLMFQAGLELDLATFHEHRSAAFIFGGLTFAIPLALGLTEGVMLGMGLGAAVLMGSIWASHTLVTLPDVIQAGLGSNRAVTATAGATVLTDTLSLLVLAVVSSMSRGGNPATVTLGLLVGLALLVAYALLALPRIGRRFFVGAGQSRTTRFVFLLFGLSSAALLGAAFGIEGLVGAFLAGLGLNKVVPNGGELMDRVEFFGAALLVPAFLIYVGTKLNPVVVLQPATVVLAALFLLALVAGKAIAAIAAGLTLKFDVNEMGLIFGMSVPQAAATLAATLVGANLGLFPERTVNAVVLVVLISLFVGSIATRFFAGRVPVKIPHRLPLGTRVLVGIRDDTTAAELARLGAYVAAGDCGTVAPVVVSTEREPDHEVQSRRLQLAEQAATAAGNDVDGRMRRSSSFTTAIRHAVDEERASAVLVAWDARTGFSERVFGTELDRMGRLIDVPIIAARLDSAPILRVVVAIDIKRGGGARALDARIALEVARRVALGGNTPLYVAVSGRTHMDAIGIEFDSERTSLATVYGPLSVDSVGLRCGDLLVMTPPRYRSGLGSQALNQIDGLSLLIVADSGRMRVSGAGAPREAYLGLEAPG